MCLPTWLLVPVMVAVELRFKGGWKVESLADFTPGRAGTCWESIVADLDEPSAVRLLSWPLEPASSYCYNTLPSLDFKATRLFVCAH